MSASDYDLDGKVEEAFRLYFSALPEFASLTIRRGIEHLDNGDITCVSHGGQEIVFGSGNYKKDVEIIVTTKLAQSDESNLDEERTAVHRANCKLVDAAVEVDDLADHLNTLMADYNFHAYGPIYLNDFTNSVEGYFARHSVKMMLLCSASVTG